MTYYIGSARHDENGKYAGGKAGDQTGLEVATQKMYNYWSKGGWVCYRAKKPNVANGLKLAMLTACSNDNIGYSQSDRYGIVRKGVDSKEPINADCSSTVRACIKKASNVDVGDFTTFNEGIVLENSGLFNKVGIVSTLSKLYDGDILVTKKKGHTVIVTSGYKRPTNAKEKPVTSASDNIFKGIQYANSFTGYVIGASINNGPELKKQRTRVLQHALNLDYKAGLVEDGEFGPKTKAALSNHYVAYGEKQYMVTAAEILYYLLGTDPKGVEMPGTFGRGLKKAAGKSKITAQDYKSLL